MWEKRTIEELRLFNPAFCGILLAECCNSFQNKNANGLPFALSIMVLPIILHKDTRTRLPQKSNALMINWIQENTLVRISFFERLMSLKKHFFEGIIYLSNERWIDISSGEYILWVGDKKILSKAAKTLDGEALECLRRSNFLGKWFASNGPAESIFSMWGILP